MAIDIKGILVSVFLPVLIGQGKDALGKLLTEFKTKDAEWYTTVVIIAYRLLKYHASELVASTENEYDDKAVAAILEAVEASATEHGVVLPA